ncbi:MAG: hypothetical protein KDC28_03640 [Saprospiraceae bacterium]|nr:hypothetical protein [Saprospiraceae bacterium]MCB9320537.1 hypothetical protein [Lewinellaceae bacterium]
MNEISEKKDLKIFFQKVKGIFAACVVPGDNNQKIVKTPGYEIDSQIQINRNDTASGSGRYIRPM